VAIQNVTLKVPEVTDSVVVDAALSARPVKEKVPAAAALDRAVSVTLPLPPRTFAVQLSLGPRVSIAFDAPLDIAYVPGAAAISESAIERRGLDVSLPVIEMRFAECVAVIDTAVHDDPLISAVMVRVDEVPVVAVGLVVFEPLHAGMAIATAIRTAEAHRMRDCMGH
jgi:hypothetical protein